MPALEERDYFTDYEILKDPYAWFETVPGKERVCRLPGRNYLAMAAHIDLDETRHGPKCNRTLNYEPSFIIRGLSDLHLTLTPAA